MILQNRISGLIFIEETLLCMHVMCAIIMWFPCRKCISVCLMMCSLMKCFQCTLHFDAFCIDAAINFSVHNEIVRAQLFSATNLLIVAYFVYLVAIFLIYCF